MGKGRFGNLLVLEALDVGLVLVHIIDEDDEVFLGVLALVVDLGLLSSALHFDGCLVVCERFGWCDEMKCFACEINGVSLESLCGFVAV